MDLIRNQGGSVDHGLDERKWTIETEGWIWYGVSKPPPFDRATNGLPLLQRPWTYRRNRFSAIRKPMYPTSPPIVVRARGSHILPSSHNEMTSHRPTSGQSYSVSYWVPSCSPTTNLPTSDILFAYNGRSAAESSLVGLLPPAEGALLTHNGTANDNCGLNSMHLTPGGTSLSPNSPTTELRNRDDPTTVPIPTLAMDQHDDMYYLQTGRPASHQPEDDSPFSLWEDPSVPCIPDLVGDETPQRKRKREAVPGQEEGTQLDIWPSKRKRGDTDVEAGTTKKQDQVDNIQCDIMNGASLAMGESILNELNQDLARLFADSPLSSCPSASPPPADSPPHWIPPVPTPGDHTAEVQVLEPAPASRFKSGGGTGKKERCPIWHVWSEVCDFRRPGRLTLTGFLC